MQSVISQIESDRDIDYHDEFVWYALAIIAHGKSADEAVGLKKYVEHFPFSEAIDKMSFLLVCKKIINSNVSISLLSPLVDAANKKTDSQWCLQLAQLLFLDSEDYKIYFPLLGENACSLLQKAISYQEITVANKSKLEKCIKAYDDWETRLQSTTAKLK